MGLPFLKLLLATIDVAVLCLVRPSNTYAELHGPFHCCLIMWLCVSVVGRP